MLLFILSWSKIGTNVRIKMDLVFISFTLFLVWFLLFVICFIFLLFFLNFYFHFCFELVFFLFFIFKLKLCLLLLFYLFISVQISLCASHNLLDPTIYEFQGNPHLDWIHELLALYQDHTSCLLLSLDDVSFL